MAESDWAILCDYAFLDERQKICMIGVFDRVLVRSVPSTLHQSSLAIRLLGDPNAEIDFRVEIIRPTGSELAKFEGPAKISETGSCQIQVNMAGLPLPDYGIYGFNIFIDNELVKTANFIVAHPPQEKRSGQ